MRRRPAGPAATLQGIPAWRDNLTLSPAWRDTVTLAPVEQDNQPAEGSDSAIPGHGGRVVPLNGNADAP